MKTSLVLCTQFSWDFLHLTNSFFSKIYFLKILFILSLEKWGWEGERQGKKHQFVVASLTPPTGHLAHNPGTCPDWELNLQPFGSQAGAQSTEPHQAGPSKKFLIAFLLLKNLWHLQYILCCFWVARTLFSENSAFTEFLAPIGKMLFFCGSVHDSSLGLAFRRLIEMCLGINFLWHLA